MTDADGNLTGMAYDGFNRLQFQYFPKTDTTQRGSYDPTDFEKYAYDLDGDRTQLTKRDHGVVNFTFDVLNRETRRTYSDTTPEVDTGYDLAGRKTSAKFTGGAGETWVWDLAGRLTSETSTDNGATRPTPTTPPATGRR